jgi:hypothetical protein
MSFVQGAHGGASGASASIACTFVSAISAAGHVEGYVTWGTDTLTDLTSVTDDKGNTCTIVDKVASGGIGQSFASFYREGINDGPVTFTANFVGTPSFRAICAAEQSGLATSSSSDGHAMQIQNAPGTGTDAITSGNGTTTVAGDTVTGGVLNIDSTAGSLVAGSNFNLRASESDTGSTCDLKAEDMVFGGSGSVAAVFTDSVRGGLDHFFVGMTAFQAAGGGGATFPPVPEAALMHDRLNTLSRM